MTDRNDNIKDIWNKHIDVQEQLLRARAVSTPIIPTSIRIVGEKMMGISMSIQTFQTKYIFRLSNDYQKLLNIIIC